MEQNIMAVSHPALYHHCTLYFITFLGNSTKRKTPSYRFFLEPREKQSMINYGNKKNRKCKFSAHTVKNNKYKA